MKNKIIVALYIRVSTQEQAIEGYSLGEQETRLKKYAEAHDWIVYKVYFDPGFSGGSLDRPGLKSLIADVAAGKVDKVLVYKLDRLSRSQKDTLYLIEDVFIENNVDFVSMTENFDTATPFGKAMIGILSVFAQLEREQIKERMSIGRHGRAKSGLWGGGSNVPIAYRYKDNALTIEPYEAEIVRRIYREYISGKTITSISSDLDREGLRSSYGKFTRTTVRQILTRPIYKGEITFNGETYPGQHEAIIDPETWEKAHVLLEESARTDVSHLYFHNRVSIITGICFCGECGRKMISRYWTQKSTGEVHKNIVCPGKKKSGCTSGAYKRAEIEEIVLNEIKKLRLDPEYMKKARSQKEPVNNDERIEILEERIASNKTRVSRLMDLYAIGGMDIEAVKEKIDALNTESESLLTEISDLKSKKVGAITDEEILDRVDRLENYIDEEDVERSRKIVTSLIDRIDLKDDIVTITWSF